MSSLSLRDKGILYNIGDIYVLKNFMPFPLKESNCYLAESDIGWTVIDTGVNIPQNRDIWNLALKEIGISFKHIKNIYLTHYHHDHIGLSGWLQYNSDCSVYISSLDHNTFHTYIKENNYFSYVKDTCINAGWTNDLIKKLADDIKNISPLVIPYPSLTICPEDKPISMANYKLYPLLIPGHTDGHYVFYSYDDHLLFSGDNIVKNTILHLTDWPHTLLTNPYKTHLDKLQNLLNLPISLVLPGHGECFSQAKDKIELIYSHHHNRRNLVLSNLSQPTTAWKLACKIFKDSEYIHIKRLILAETLAYLNSLIATGQVEVDKSNTPYIYKKSAILG